MNDEPKFIDATPVAVAPKPKANIYGALAKARGQYPQIIKNRVATIKSDKAQYSYKYADLSDVFAAIDPILSENGLTAMQFPDGANLVTVIGHESGEQITGTWPIKAMKGGDTSTAQARPAPSTGATLNNAAYQWISLPRSPLIVISTACVAT